MKTKQYIVKAGTNLVVEASRRFRMPIFVLEHLIFWGFWKVTCTESREKMKYSTVTTHDFVRKK